MAYLAKSTVLHAYKLLSGIDSEKQQGLTQKVSALKYVSALDLFYKHHGQNCDLKQSANRDEFASNVGKIVKINEEYCTKDFFLSISQNGRDFDCGSNFYSQSSVKDSKTNPNNTFLYPKRSGWKPVMDIQNQVLIYMVDYLNDCFSFYLGSSDLRLAFIIWLLRFKQIPEENLNGIKSTLNTVFTSDYSEALYTDDVNHVDTSYVEFDEDVCQLINEDVHSLFANSSDPSIDKTKTMKNPLQQIFYGAPGTGKSNTIKNVTQNLPKENVFRTTFHPDSDYSTFVGCYKPASEASKSQVKRPVLDYDSLVDKFKEYLNVPNANITKICTLFGYDYHDSIVRMQEQGRKVMDLVNDAYKSNTSYDSVVRGGMACYEQNPIVAQSSQITYSFVPQAFTKAYLRAWQTTEPVYLVIEEINRGNCAQIFGDLFQLLDRKNGISEYPIKPDADLGRFVAENLTNPVEGIPDEIRKGEELMLPSNLYIWATMNTSDQSLFPIDSAFKRRWEWKYIKIKEGKDENGNKLDWKVDVKMDEPDTLLSWWDFIQKINEIIASMTSSADKQLGYFFCCAKDGVIDEEAFVSKVIFYLWNDVFKDYGFEDASLFRYTDKEGKEQDLTFPDFYDDEGEKVNKERLTDFVKKVMSWKVDNKKDED